MTDSLCQLLDGYLLMHEYSVTQGILTIVVEAAQRAGGRPIETVDLVIGDLSSIIDDSVQFYFDVLSRGTLAEGAALRFRRVSPQVLCRQCGHATSGPPPLPEACPACGSYALQVQGGQEFFVESIEVQDEN